ncbi:MAG: hypothetical protein JRS35_05615 [Deltaproteobacteria bacterium]|nr:hypothetical protein [Deltaproteobacteria bacterium]
MRLRTRKRMVIDSAWLVRALASGRRWQHCAECGGRMFVKAPSGLCPVCFTRRRDRRQEIERVVQKQAGAALEDWTATS